MTWTAVRRSAPMVAALLLTSACGSATGRPGGAVTSAPSARPGESVKFAVYSHCGVESARINGYWWHADPPLYNDDRTGPPDK